ncbi:site-2 protease family protein [Marinimicrobium sp. ABcell2]|uniref:site-2 protease family protein n=1 Tax=Marinimicrobium sp. ABcell2 TaxID=3069751 RepID=UPI0027B42DB1|nr:site-2 protease family protein [Marinimicrobium sp. ABcell2]MDQ2076903.1 site-2 protease family protein [Marinimicrobium sp. ABcell2]
MRSGLSVGRIAGIQIQLDWSLLLIFGLITVVLGTGVFPTWHPDWSTVLVWTTAFSASFLFFVSVLLHELSHALVGRRFGAKVPRITLFLFGGMAHLEREPKTWKAEFWMAIVGPIASFAIGFLCLFLSGVVAGVDGEDFDSPQQFLGALGPVPTMLLWLGSINIILALFNMVPGFPLDGGRVLRAIIWGATGNQHKATRWAASAGQAFAWILIASGIAMIFGATVPVFGTGTVNGLWIAFIGWFLNNAAMMSYQQMTMQESLDRVPVSQIMQHDIVTLAPDTHLQILADDYVLRSSQRCFPVESDKILKGLVCLEDLRRTLASERSQKSVADIMTPTEQLKTVQPDDDAAEAFQLLGSSDINQLPVLKQGRLVGLLTRENLMRWLALNQKHQ